MPLESAGDGFEKWTKEVRDPAQKSTEGRRKIEVSGAWAEYEVAPLQDGRWAVRISTRMESSSGMYCPWRSFSTRDECVDWFLKEALAFFQREKNLKKGREQNRKKIVDLLRLQGLFGWEEPEIKT